MVQALRDDPRRDDCTVALSFGGLQWGTVMGVLDHGLRSGVPMCIANEDFAGTVPARDVCDGGADEWPVLIAPTQLRRSGDRVATGPPAVVVVPEPDANRGASVDAPRSRIAECCMTESDMPPPVARGTNPGTVTSVQRWNSAEAVQSYALRQRP